MGLKVLPSLIDAVPALLRAPDKLPDQIYTSPEWRSLVDRLKAQRGAWCERCGSKARLVGDHVQELRDGGAAFDETNVKLLCYGCHARKTAQARQARSFGRAAGGGASQT